MLVTLFATRSVGAEATTGLAANGHLMAVGESGEESPFDADPRATRPTQCEVVEEAVAECVSKPSEGVGLRGEWVVPFSSGAGLRASQREKVVAPRPMGLRARIIPVFVPAWSLPHRARRFGSAFAFPNGFTTTKPAPRGLCEKKSHLGG